MYVITVLVMTVAVVDVIYMVTMLHGFVSVTLEVLTFVILVDVLFAVPFAVMEVVHVAVVFAGVVTVSGEVLMVCSRVYLTHDSSLHVRYQVLPSKPHSENRCH